jgi:tetratricopeptide (TPR) repeat protein
MLKLEPPNTHHLSAVIGWLELGNLSEAKAELAQIAPEHHNHPDVLEVRWRICAELEAWVEGLQVAQAILRDAPDRSSGWLHQAYALRRVPDGTVKMAWEALLPAFDKFPKEPIISYNLSCYACQMRQLDAARTWFKRALVIGRKERERIKRMALQDPDLEALWEEIGQL